MKFTLPTDSAERKDVPVTSGCLAYFPAALAGVARVSKAGNDKHNPGQPLHHARGKSGDHADCIVRHLMDVQDLVAAFERGPDIIDTQAILNEANQLAWRALALSQELHERFGGAPLAPAAKLPEDVPAYRFINDVGGLQGVAAPQLTIKAGGWDGDRSAERDHREKKQAEWDRQRAENEYKPGQVFPPPSYYPTKIYLGGPVDGLISWPVGDDNG